jgi:hypothetical protein
MVPAIPAVPAGVLLALIQPASDASSTKRGGESQEVGGRRRGITAEGAEEGRVESFVGR